MLRCNFISLVPRSMVHFPSRSLKKFFFSYSSPINNRFSVTFLSKFSLVVWISLVPFKIYDCVSLFSNTSRIPLGVSFYWGKRQALFIFHLLLCFMLVCIPHHKNNSHSDHRKVFVYLTISYVTISSCNALFVLAAWKRCISNVYWHACLLTHQATAQDIEK